MKNKFNIKKKYKTIMILYECKKCHYQTFIEKDAIKHRHNHFSRQKIGFFKLF